MKILCFSPWYLTSINRARNSILGVLSIAAGEMFVEVLLKDAVHRRTSSSIIRVLPRLRERLEEEECTNLRVNVLAVPSAIYHAYY